MSTSSGSSIGATGNTATTGSSVGGSVAKTGSSVKNRSTIASTVKSTGGVTAPAGRTTMTRNFTTINPTTKTPVIGSLEDYAVSRDADPLFNQEETIESLQNEYATIIEQKMYAEVLKALVGRETKEFNDWASERNISLNTPKNIQDFIDTIGDGQFTTDDKMNTKIDKLIKYIPDIVGSLANNSALAPASKVVSGENPIVDEIKFTTEKIIAPTMKKVGQLLEKRLGTEFGKRMGKSLVAWGERLATLPTKILEGIGPADVVLSAIDAGLLAIDQATGNYRQTNHDLPEEVLGIPIIGQGLEILSTLRDFIDTAGGIPRDDEAIPQLYERLQKDLWNPAIEEHTKVMNMFANKESEFKELAERVERQSSRNVVYTTVLPRLEEIATDFGNNREDMRDYINKELGIKYDSSLPSATQAVKIVEDAQKRFDLNESQIRDINRLLIGSRGQRTAGILAEKQKRIDQNKELDRVIKNASKTLEKSVVNDRMEFLEKDIDAMIDFEIGRISRTELDARLEADKVIVPTIEPIINGAEVRARVSLDNVYSTQTAIKGLEADIDKKQDEINKKQGQINNEYRFASSGGGLTEIASAFGGIPKASRDFIAKKEAEIRELEGEIQTIKDENIPQMGQELESVYDDFLESLESAEELGIDLSFLKRSANWDKALSDIEDDSLFWRDNLLQFLPGATFF